MFDLQNRPFLAKVIFIACLAMLLSASALTAQIQTVGCTDEDQITPNGSFQIFRIDPAFTGTLRITLEGAEGGDATVRNVIPIIDETTFCIGDGGVGVAIGADFTVAETGNDALRPGGDLRFILGERGESSLVDGTLSVGKTVGGGGGGSALYYRSTPTSPWGLLMVAGGGGGGTATTGVGFCDSFNGFAAGDENLAGQFSGGGAGNEAGGGGGGGLSNDGGGQTCVTIEIPPQTITVLRNSGFFC